MPSIKERRAKLEAEIKAAKAQIKVMEAQRKVIEAECEHPHMESYKSYDYGGGCDLHTKCPDCGYHKVT